VSRTKDKRWQEGARRGLANRRKKGVRIDKKQEHKTNALKDTPARKGEERTKGSGAHKRGVLQKLGEGQRERQERVRHVGEQKK